MPTISASIRRIPDPRFVQPSKSVFVSQTEREGVTTTVVSVSLYRASPGAMVYNQPGSNRPSKIRGYEESPLQTGIAEAAQP